MPGTARKTADAAPAAEEAEPAVAQAQPQAPVAEEAPVEEAHRPAVEVVFAGQAQCAVAGVGLCDPGVAYPVRAALADALCGGDSPLFTRATAA